MRAHERRRAWWAENLERVKRRWTAGESAGLIASTTPGAPSRNGIIGKMHREGLGRPPEEARKPRAPAAARSERRAEGPPRRVWPPRRAPRLRTIPYDPARAADILSVRGCLYPVEERDGEHLFCNAPSRGSYCRGHARLCRAETAEAPAWAARVAR